MSILKNAIDSIAIGLEDYESTDDRRIVSATRNIFAGILLLFKHRLCELSPPDSDEALIKQIVLPRMDDTGAVNWIGKGNKTVDVQNIKERFESLDIKVEWKSLEIVNKYRNDIEHYYSTLKKAIVQQLISDSFIIIRDFISEQLEQDPKALLGEDYWKILVDVNEVYKKEKSDCDSAIKKLKFMSDKILYAFQYVKCHECGSGLIEPTKNDGYALDSSFKCRSCNHSEAYDDLVSSAVNEYFSAHVFSSHKDGDDTPIIDCPSCFNGVYIYQDNICASCGYSAECSMCGGNIHLEGIGYESHCDYCQYMWDKMQAE